MPKDTTTRFMLVALHQFVEACKLHDMENLNDRHLELVEGVWNCRKKRERKLTGSNGSVIKKTYTHDTLFTEGEVFAKGELCQYVSSRGRQEPSSPSKNEKELDRLLADATVARYELSVLDNSGDDANPKFVRALRRLESVATRLETSVGKKAVGSGMPWKQAAAKAERLLRKNNGHFPGLRALADAVGCSTGTMSKAIRKSPYLAARVAEHKATSSPKKGREVQMPDDLLAGPSREEAIEHLTDEQQADQAREDRQHMAAKR